MSDKQRIDRRNFLKGSASSLAAASALSSALGLGASSARAQESQGQPKPAKPSPNERLVVGMIGTGDLGRRLHMQHFILPDSRFEMAAVCDVDRNHRDQAARMVFDSRKRRPGVYKDFRKLLDRKDLDAVFIITPDHWHSIPAIAAMEAGLDIYCEKPLTLTIGEGIKMVDVARRYGTVFQTGSMQRSDLRFRKACELVRNKKIGEIKTCHTHIGGVGPGNWQPYQTAPDELDWNFWLGPAPYEEFFPNRCHYQFRWFLDYSGGKMTDWGAHHNDIVQWALGMDETGPVSVKGNGNYHQQGPHDVAGSFDVHYKYANGIDLHCHSGGENGVKFEGTDGWLFVSRGRIEASDPAILESELGPDDVRLYNTGDSPNNWHNHYNDWLECIKTRERPICDVSVGHRSATVCHLGNIAMMLGRKLEWDPQKEQFVNDPVANKHLLRPMRAPWHI